MAAYCNRSGGVLVPSSTEQLGVRQHTSPALLYVIPAERPTPHNLSNFATIHNTIRPSSERQRGKTGVKKMKRTFKRFESEHPGTGILPAPHDFVLIDEQECVRPQCPVHPEHATERCQRLETLNGATCWSTSGATARWFLISCWHAIYMLHKTNSNQNKSGESVWQIQKNGWERTTEKTRESRTM